MKTGIALLTAPLLSFAFLVAGCSDEQAKDDYEAKVERELEGGD